MDIGFFYHNDDDDDDEDDDDDDDGNGEDNLVDIKIATIDRFRPELSLNSVAIFNGVGGW